MNGIHDRLRRFDGEKRELLALLLEEQGIRMDEAIIPPVERNRTDYPLSFAQQRFWFQAQLHAGDTALNITAALHLDGPLAVAALGRAFERLIGRHEILRTRFLKVEGTPRQNIRPQGPAPFQLIDLSRLAEPACRAYSDQIIAAMTAIPFNLETGPLLQLALIRTRAESHLLTVNLHHLIADGWASGILVSELGALYRASLSGAANPLKPLAIQYLDFACWQRESENSRWEAGLAYWKKHLAEIPELLSLPTDRPRRALQHFDGATRPLLMSAELLSRVKAFAARHGARLFVVLQTAFVTFLSRYSGQTDIVTGSNITLRDRPELEPLLGFLANTVVFRGDLSQNPGFSDLLKRAQREAESCFEFRHIPFEQIVETVRPERTAEHSPLFQVLFDLRNTPTARLELPGLHAVPAAVPRSSTLYDLAWIAEEREGRLSGFWEYRTDLFEAQTIARMMAHFLNLLNQALAQPERPYTRLNLLEEDQRATLLRDLHHNQPNFPIHGCPFLLFEERAQSCPDRIAIRGKADFLSYSEVGREARRRGHRLLEHGIGPERVVALMGDRGSAYWIGVLAVFGVGAVYLPLDPTHPDARLKQVLETCEPALVFCQDDYRGALERIGSEGTFLKQTRLLRLDDPDTMDTASLKLSPATSDNLAYLIFTSGSTGRPKGAMVHRSGMLNHLFNKIHDLELGPDQTVAQNAASSFDISIWQCFAPLLAGSTVHLIDEETARDPRALFHRVERDGITLLEVVPSLLRSAMALDQLKNIKMGSLRRLMVTGENLPADLCESWLGRFPAIPLINAYGPTECSDDVTHALLERESANHGTLPPIGKPLANLTVYLLDLWLEPLPAGIRGQIYIGGAGVGRGYFTAPDQTAAVFIPDPFSEEPGQRLYVSGDLGFRRDDGQLVFAQRLDRQIKFRGYRIELDDIGSTLRRHTLLRDAITILNQDSLGQQQLLAYVVPGADSILDASKNDAAGAEDEAQKNDLKEQLRQHCRSLLPDYMIPAHFVVLKHLPLTANGKIDTKALPRPSAEPEIKREQNPGVQRPMEPRDLIEWKMARIWAEALQLTRVNLLDNFFEMGGHSLLAVRVLDRVQEEFGRELSLNDLFQAPTVAGFSGLLRGQKHQAQSPLVVFEKGHGLRPFFCIHPVSGSVLCYWELARCLGPDQPFYALQSPSLYGQPAADSVEEMAQDYLEQLRRIQPVGPYQLGGWSFGGLVAYEMACRLERAGETVRFLALIDSFPTEPSTSFGAEEEERLFDAFLLDLAKIGGLDSSAVKTRQERGPAGKSRTWIQTLGLLPEGMEEKQAEWWWLAYRNNYLAARRFRPKPYTGEVHLMLAEAEENETKSGWCEFTGTRIHKLATDHYDLLRQPRVSRLADLLKNHLQQEPYEEKPTKSGPFSGLGSLLKKLVSGR